MKKINSSSLLISISFILTLSLITSIFLIGFQNNVNIENKSIKESILNFKIFENYKNELQFNVYQSK